MSRGVLETLVGGAVLMVAAGFAWFAVASTGFGGRGDSYPLSARFETAGGLTVGTDVRLSGIKVGTVTGVALDPQTFLAEITFSVPNTVRLPIDSVVEVGSDGLLGGRYLKLVPGADDKTITPGGRVTRVTPPVDLMDLIGRAIFSGAQGAAGGSAPR
ncbi:MAG: outer membrane lipid asymmetry maintenance protein MlaD [Alphaproteobacteria bacterium]|nr:outer membrane lipid asymmetry maintenance protein MlaD [Alphaproteobacteria bacterium]TAD91450.1 MAG: outer membrane lipid asymmetry maintenance protein MlaD [Alphaproteobacteria bacterium]